MKPRVIMVGPSLDARGGVASVANSLIKEPAMRELGVVYVSTWSEGRALRKWATFLLALPRIAALAGKGRIVHVHMASRGSFYRKALVLALARLRGSFTLIHLHGAEFHLFFESSRPIVRSLIQRVFSSASAVVVLSDEWRSRVERIAECRCLWVIPNPVSIPEHTASGSNPPHVVFMGRLSSRKGSDVLLSSIGLIQSRGVQASYTLAGDGDISRYRELAQGLPQPSEVRIPGWLGNQEKRALLSSADVYCLPSRDEGVPIGILEAMAWGLACVATPVGGVPSVIINDFNGILVEVGNDQALADALADLIRHPDKRRVLGERAREYVSGRHRADLVANRIVEMYACLLAEERVGRV